MRGPALLLLAGCGGVSASGSVTASASTTVSTSTSTLPTTDGTSSETSAANVVCNVGEAHGRAPDHEFDHEHGDQHETPTHQTEVDKLYIEVTSQGDHGEVLRKTATSALGSIPYAVPTEEGADLELYVELASLTPAECKVKIYMLRLPQHDLLAIADGAAQRTGRTADDLCLSMVDDAIVRTKLPPFLQKRLDDKK